jgi:hypothetical protein
VKPGFESSPVIAKHKFFLLYMLGRLQTKLLEQALKECFFSPRTLKFFSDTRLILLLIFESSQMQLQLYFSAFESQIQETGSSMNSSV